MSFNVGDLLVRLKDHPLVKAGEIHPVTKTYRGGYLGFGGRIGGEWNPDGWARAEPHMSDLKLSAQVRLQADRTFADAEKMKAKGLTLLADAHTAFDAANDAYRRANDLEAMGA